jgi:cytidyltransferase-like protein
MLTSTKSRKKVLVSGCFDLLHSGHVEFFLAAAKHGDLYVRIGTAANVKALKNHDVMYGDDERVFMVGSIACVHDVATSKGTGVYDFETDMELIKPDIYFVNEDASKLEGRVAICERLGVEMIVAPREPHEGLAVRSSTSVKADLAARAAAEDLEFKRSSQACFDEPVAPFHRTIPWRLCFAGGWMDLEWCNVHHPGCIVTINIKFNEAVCKDRCGLATSSRRHAIKTFSGRIPANMEAVDVAKIMWCVPMMRLVLSLPNAASIAREARARTAHAPPAPPRTPPRDLAHRALRCALRRLISFVCSILHFFWTNSSALRRRPSFVRSPLRPLPLRRGAENFSRYSTARRSYAAGSQDHCGLMFPGINKLCYGSPSAAFPESAITLNDPTDPAQAAIFAWLESVLRIVEVPFVSRPADFDSQRINLLKDPSVSAKRKRELVGALADASERAWTSIVAMDAPGLGRALSDTMLAWAAMLPCVCFGLRTRASVFCCSQTLIVILFVCLLEYRVLPTLSNGLFSFSSRRYTVDPYRACDGYAGDPAKSAELRSWVAAYEAETLGCLFSGAGGGFLMCIAEDGAVRDGLAIEVNNEHFAKPFPSQRVGDEPRDLQHAW